MDREFYSRHLPHWHPPGATFFLTARLHGSLPQTCIQQLRAEYEMARVARSGDDPATTAARVVAAQRSYFAAVEQHLEHGRYGPVWLADERVAALTLAVLREQAAAAAVDVLIACLMPNHVHIVLTMPSAPLALSLQSLLQRWKSLTARAANVLLGREGRFWQSETYDHVVRGGWPGVGQAVRYTALNPCKAGLCQEWYQWHGLYVSPQWAEALTADLGGP